MSESDSSIQEHKNVIKLSIDEPSGNENIEELNALLKSDPKIYNSSIANPSLFSIDTFCDTLPNRENTFSNQPKKYDIPSIPVTLRRNIDRSQNVYVVVDDNPPPPYDDSTIYVYRDGRYVPINRPARDTSRTPPTYQRTQMEYMGVFEDASIRSNFVKKVYAILALQLLFTFGFIALCIFEENVKAFMVDNSFALFLSSSLLYFILAMVIVCYDKARRIFPWNFILLIAFTVALTILAATFSCFYSTYTVVVAFGVTTLVCLAISFLACLPCIDITGCGIFLLVGSIIIAVYGIIAVIVAMFTGYSIVFLIYAWLATILIAFYLLYDTQLILGGKRFELSTEEYIMGAVTLYTDIVTMFIYILCLFGYNR